MNRPRLDRLSFVPPALLALAGLGVIGLGWLARVVDDAHDIDLTIDLEETA